MIIIQFYKGFSVRRSQRLRWRIVDASNGKILATSGEGYANTEDCEDAAFKVVGMGSSSSRKIKVETSDNWPES